MNLLPSDPLYEMIMADQAEENPSTILPDAFRCKIYNISTPESENIFPDILSPDNDGMCYAIGDFSYIMNANYNHTPDFSGEGYGEGTAESYGIASDVSSEENYLSENGEQIV